MKALSNAEIDAAFDELGIKRPSRRFEVWSKRGTVVQAEARVKSSTYTLMQIQALEDECIRISEDGSFDIGKYGDRWIANIYGTPFNAQGDIGGDCKAGALINALRVAKGIA